MRPDLMELFSIFTINILKWVDPRSMFKSNVGVCQVKNMILRGIPLRLSIKYPPLVKKFEFLKLLYS